MSKICLKNLTSSSLIWASYFWLFNSIFSIIYCFNVIVKDSIIYLLKSILSLSETDSSLYSWFFIEFISAFMRSISLWSYFDSFPIDWFWISTIFMSNSDPLSSYLFLIWLSMFYTLFRIWVLYFKKASDWESICSNFDEINCLCKWKSSWSFWTISFKNYKFKCDSSFFVFCSSLNIDF